MTRLALVVLLAGISFPASAITYTNADVTSSSISAYIEIEAFDGVDYWIEGRLDAPEATPTLDIFIEERDVVGVLNPTRRFNGRALLSFGGMDWGSIRGDVAGVSFAVSTHSVSIGALPYDVSPLVQQRLSGVLVETRVDTPASSYGIVVVDGQSYNWANGEGGSLSPLVNSSFFGDADSLDWSGHNVPLTTAFNIQRGGIQYIGRLYVQGSVSVSTVPVPEPSTALLVGMGLAMLVRATHPTQ